MRASSNLARECSWDLIEPLPGIDGVVAAVVRCAASLERVGQASVDPSWARRTLAPLTRTARGLPPGERDQLREQLQAISRFVRSQSVSAQLLRLLDAMLEDGEQTAG